MDLIDPDQLTGRWRPPSTWREALGQTVPAGSPVRHVGDLLDVQLVDGLPDNRMFLVSSLGPNEVLEGESPAEALVRLGRIVGVQLVN